MGLVLRLHHDLAPTHITAARPAMDSDAPCISGASCEPVSNHWPARRTKQKIGGPCASRTHDQQIKSLLLYRLS